MKHLPLQQKKILLAATDLFAANHFNGVSIKEIAKKSGVNSALISYYFGGKKKIFIRKFSTNSQIYF
ncbi:TetR family transcriptional regulator [Phascolarctobacterium faecium]|uniref:TetR family transcriptional regulator n=1 Tax=Phascolarctobacterium faecium TaxID=33025 RepID=UPI00399A76B0